MTNGDGIVRIAEFSGRATWKSPGDQFYLIRFEMSSLTDEQCRQLEHLRVSPKQVLLQLPGEDAQSGFVIGYEHNRLSQTLHVAAREFRDGDVQIQRAVTDPPRKQTIEVKPTSSG